jgi:hypothetical protein
VFRERLRVTPAEPPDGKSIGYFRPGRSTHPPAQSYR